MGSNMFTVCKISGKEYSSLLNNFTNDSPLLFQQANCLEFYGNVEYIKVINDKRAVCAYAYPIITGSNKISVRRPYRLLPYSLPAILPQTTQIEEKLILRKLFSYLFQKDVVYIPLFYQFKNLMSIQSLGGFLEQRSTHYIENNGAYELPQKLKKEINKIDGNIEIKEECSADLFNYEKAICGTEISVLKRREFAKFVFNNSQAFILNAYDRNKKNIAGVFIMLDKSYAYLFHSWREKDSERGVIPMLIQSAISKCFNILNLKGFDFEGSVIDSIDDFFSGFNTSIVSYPFIHFAKKDIDFIELINTSIMIEGRISND